jgi:two-component system cell cycle response regulator CtrA
MTSVFLYEPRDDRRSEILAELLSAQMEPVQINDSFFQRDLGQLNRDGSIPQPFLMASSTRALEHIRKLRAAGCLNPVLVIRESRNSQETAEALDVGADDDIILPVNGIEVRSRISSIVRRTCGHMSDSITIDEVTAYMDGRDPKISGNQVKLTPREYAIFQYLFVNSPKVVSRIAIYDTVYSLADTQPFDKVIDVYICKIRKKISAASESGYHYIETVFGRGYKFSPLLDFAKNADVVSSNSQISNRNRQAFSGSVANWGEKTF